MDNLLVGCHAAYFLQAVVVFVQRLQKTLWYGWSGQIGGQLLIIIIRALLHKECLPRVTQFHLYVHGGAIDFNVNLPKEWNVNRAGMGPPTNPPPCYLPPSHDCAARPACRNAHGRANIGTRRPFAPQRSHRWLRSVWPHWCHCRSLANC